MDDGFHECHFCLETFLSEAERYRHRVNAHLTFNNRNPGICAVCHEQFSGYFTFADHFIEAHNAKLQRVVSHATRLMGETAQTGPATLLQALYLSPFAPDIHEDFEDDANFDSKVNDALEAIAAVDAQRRLAHSDESSQRVADAPPHESRSTSASPSSITVPAQAGGSAVTAPVAPETTNSFLHLLYLRGIVFTPEQQAMIAQPLAEREEALRKLFSVNPESGSNGTSRNAAQEEEEEVAIIQSSKTENANGDDQREEEENQDDEDDDEVVCLGFHTPAAATSATPMQPLNPSADAVQESHQQWPQVGPTVQPPLEQPPVAQAQPPTEAPRETPDAPAVSSAAPTAAQPLRLEPPEHPPVHQPTEQPSVAPAPQADHPREVPNSAAPTAAPPQRDRVQQSPEHGATRHLRHHHTPRKSCEHPIYIFWNGNGGDECPKCHKHIEGTCQTKRQHVLKYHYRSYYAHALLTGSVERQALERIIGRALGARRRGHRVCFNCPGERLLSSRLDMCKHMRKDHQRKFRELSSKYRKHQPERNPAVDIDAILREDFEQ